MKDTEIEKLRQIVSRNDISGNEKVEMLIIFTENYQSIQLMQTDVSKRYFIVFYIANVVNGRLTAYCDFTTSKGEYLNKKTTIKQLEEFNKTATDIVITNIIELNECDFNEWVL